MLQKGEKIGEEEIKCKAMADLALADLNEAIPALEAAMKVEYACVCQLRGGTCFPLYPVHSFPQCLSILGSLRFLTMFMCLASCTIHQRFVG